MTVSNAASHYINETIIGANKSHPIISHVICTKEQLHVPIFKNMPVMLLENRDKATGYVNGQICKIHCMEGSTIIVKHKKGHYINIYLVTCPLTKKVYYPLRPAYSCTIAKVQGQTLANAILWVDTASTPPGTCYVALSRVRRNEDMLSLCQLRPKQFTPVA